MRVKFKALTLRLSQAYKKGQWNRFVISFLILAQLGLLAIADGWASPPEDFKIPVSAAKVSEVVAGNAAPDAGWNPAAEAATFQELIQVSGTDLDGGVIYAWVQVPRPAGQNGLGEDSQNLAARCQQKIMEQIQEQNPAAVPYIADSSLIETKHGELIKISTRNLGALSPNYPEATSFYLLVEASQIASAERAVFLRQLVTRALKATLTDDLWDSLEPDSIVTDGINSEGIKSDGIEPNGIETVPVKCSLNLTLSRSGRLTQADQLKLVKRMLAASGAVNIQGINSSELISLTAYTPRLAGYETLAGVPVNLQIASRYHSLDNRTYFQIGAPLLMIEY